MTEVLEYPNAPPSQLVHIGPTIIAPLSLSAAPGEANQEADMEDHTKVEGCATHSAESEQGERASALQPPTLDTNTATVKAEEVKTESAEPQNVPTPSTSLPVEKLERNCAIPVTVDDLNEGMIVVSFLHNNVTYQGVLLQLNRERGIPCGISFPKEFYPSANSTGDADPNDPNQVAPLNQRDTYFQQNGTGGGGTSKSRLALRRVIKPPARYKHGRGHLKLRARPVLCIKCRALCEEKNAAENNGNDANDSDKKQNTTIVGGVTTRRGYAKFISSCNGTDNNDANGEARKDEDLSFKSIGSTGIVDNYWKRPMNEAKVEPAAQGLTNLTVNVQKMNMKGVKTMPELKPMVSGTSSGSATAASAASKNPILLKSLTAPLKHSAQHAPSSNETSTSSDATNETQQAKTKSLGDCIQSLTTLQEKNAPRPEVNRRKMHKSRVIRNVPSSGSDSESNGSTGSITRSASAKLPMQIKQEPGNAGSSAPGRRKSSTKSEVRNGSRKRSSTIPERYRDEANVFSFKKRRINENGAAGPGAGSNELAAVQFNDELPMSLVGCLEKRHPTNPHHLTLSSSKPTASGSTKVSSPKETAKKYQELKVNVKERSVVASSISPNSNNSATNTSTSTKSSNPAPSTCSSSSVTAGTSASFTNTGSTANAEQLQEVHSNKTPVIKITFGTSGNGVVVQIPPKETQNPSASVPSIIPPGPEASTAANSKAVRKAMKRAKKAAKKNRSISFESALPSSSRGLPKPSSSIKMFDNRPSTSAYVVTSTSVPTSSGRVQHSPSPPVLNPEYPFLSPDYHSSSESSNINSEDPHHHVSSLKVDFPTPSAYVAKKKKKDKRKKKSKASTGKQIAKASSSTSVSKSDTLDSSCTSSSGSHMSILSLCEDSKLRRLYHPEEGPLTTDDDTDVDSSAPVLKNELLESLKYESENSATSASTENDHPERLCISLKRLSSTSNAYVTCSKSTMSETANRAPIGASTSAAADSSDNAVAGPSSMMRNPSQNYKLSIKKLQQSLNARKNLNAEAAESSDTSTTEMNNNNYSTASEASDNEFPMNNAGSPAYDENFGGSANSIDSYSVGNPPITFRKRDVIWGKLGGCPWWPGQILDILYITEDDIRAKVSWFNATTQSYIGFHAILPFAIAFDEKFNRARRRATYKKAVRQALIEAHRNNPEDLPSD